MGGGRTIRGERVSGNVSFVVFPGSSRILEIMSREGLLTDLLAAGATVSEPTCGSCAGIGHVPAAGGKSLRAFNRNFPGRSGVKDDQIYLCSPLTAAASALTGVITDPRTARHAAGALLPGLPRRLGRGSTPARAGHGSGSDDGAEGAQYQAGAPRPPVEARCGAGAAQAGGQGLHGRHLALGHGGADFPLECARHLRVHLQERGRGLRGPRPRRRHGVLVGGEIYGHGSSREAAVLSPLHLGVRAVLAKSFARIHRANLINWGLVPLEFEDPADYDAIERDDILRFDDLRDARSRPAPDRGDQRAHRAGRSRRAAC